MSTVNSVSKTSLGSAVKEPDMVPSPRVGRPDETPDSSVSRITVDDT